MQILITLQEMTFLEKETKTDSTWGVGVDGVA